MSAGTREGRPVTARLLVGAAGIVVSAAALHRDRVDDCEARAFRLVNEQPDRLFPPVWVIMQAGTLAAAPVAAGAAWLTGRRALAARLLVTGTAAWAGSKLVKYAVRRPRPAALLPGTRCRGREQSGLGYLSGHAGVAMALAAGAWPDLDCRGRSAVAVAVPSVALARLYVGAHLPLDVVGGAALGLAVDAAWSLRLSGTRPARLRPLLR